MAHESKRNGELRYIEALTESYPEPISHTELATRVGVSKAAVTKAKDKLMGVCDLSELVYDKFVLKDDMENLKRVGELFFLRGRFFKFLTSGYTLFILKRLNIHDKIAESWPSYGEIFEKGDTDFMMEIVMRNLSVAKEIQQITRRVGNREERLYLQSMQTLKQLDPIMKKIELHIKDKKVLIRFLVLRDKWFSLFMHELSNLVQIMEILKELSDDEKKVFIDVYIKTLDFYLGRSFKALSHQLAEKAAEGGVKFGEEYHVIGRFYRNSRRKVAQPIG